MRLNRLQQKSSCIGRSEPDLLEMMKSLCKVPFELISLRCLEHRKTDRAGQIMAEPEDIGRQVADANPRSVQGRRNRSDARLEIGPPPLKDAVQSIRLHRV